MQFWQSQIQFHPLLFLVYRFEKFIFKKLRVLFFYFPLWQPQVLNHTVFVFWSQGGPTPRSPGFQCGLRWEFGGMQRGFNEVAFGVTVSQLIDCDTKLSQISVCGGDVYAQPELTRRYRCSNDRKQQGSVRPGGPSPSQNPNRRWCIPVVAVEVADTSLTSMFWRSGKHRRRSEHCEDLLDDT